jgi:uncharacterized ferritin-like protein (DUF455 family)
MSHAASALAAATSAAVLPAPDFTAASPSHASLLAYAVAVLETPDHLEKARLTFEAHHFYHNGRVPLFPASDAAFPVPPLKPARPAHLTVVPAKDLLKPQKGSEPHAVLFNRMRLIHSLAHIESYAIDLSWDILVRFATESDRGIESTEWVALPKEFYEDWLRIACEEARHFSIWNRRLEEFGYHYGSLPVHDGLWQSAGDTSSSLLARLAIVHCVHEARGLDQSPKMMQQLVSFGDKASMQLLEIIEKDELTHVASGLRWFKHLCAHHRVSAEAAEKPLDAIPTFHDIVRKNFRGSLLPPFNTPARTQCGFTEEWYLPLAVKKEFKPAAAAAVAPDDQKQATPELAKGAESASVSGSSGAAEKVTEQLSHLTVASAP